MSIQAKKIGVVLCGSGFLDGSEIRESVAALWALSAAQAQVQVYAPDLPQYDVVNCLTRKVSAGESRNMLVEAARIARGQLQPLSQARAQELDALILPGGFGAAKNLCDFAARGVEAQVLPELQNLLQNLHVQKKPLGAICIAPAILALAFRGQGFTLTLGAEGDSAKAVEKLGHRHQVCVSKDCVVDEVHRVVSTPAYMHDQAPLHDVFEGIQKLVQAVVRLSASA